MSITVVHNLPEDKWRSFVEKHPAGNIFHSPEMFQVFSRTKGYRPELWAATKDSRILALFLPVQVTLVDGVLRHFTTRSVAYGSVLCVSNAEGQEALDRMLQIYKHELYGASLFTELRNFSNLEAVQPLLLKHGFVYEDNTNYLINLNRPLESIFQDIGRRTRKNIRRGLRRGEVVIEVVEEREGIAISYDLLRRTYRKANIPLADRSLFEAVFDLLYPKGMALFTLASVGQTPVAISVDLLYKDVILGWYGGMDRTYSSYIPNELLTWHILQWGAQNGYSLYDFGGAGKSDQEYGVRDFKAKFGGKLVSYGRNTYIASSRRLWLSKQGYRLLRRWL